jgi:hypothetical protein
MADKLDGCGCHLLGFFGLQIMGRRLRMIYYHVYTPTSFEDSPLGRTFTSQHLSLSMLAGFFACVGIDLVADLVLHHALLYRPLLINESCSYYSSLSPLHSTTWYMSLEVRQVRPKVGTACQGQLFHELLSMENVEYKIALATVSTMV